MEPAPRAAQTTPRRGTMRTSQMRSPVLVLRHVWAEEGVINWKQGSTIQIPVGGTPERRPYGLAGWGGSVGHPDRPQILFATRCARGRSVGRSRPSRKTPYPRAEKTKQMKTACKQRAGAVYTVSRGGDAIRANSRKTCTSQFASPPSPHPALYVVLV